MNALKKGMRVTVYQKPFTQEDQEGIAMLVKREIRANIVTGFESWHVRFPDESQTYRRLVAIRDILK